MTIVTVLLGWSRASWIRDSADSQQKRINLVFIFICKRLANDCIELENCAALPAATPISRLC